MNHPTHLNLTTSSELLQFAKDRLDAAAPKKRVSLSQLAKRGGFKSRAYVNEVIRGKRRLTLTAVPSFSDMLELTRAERQLLTALAEVESGIPEASNRLKRIHSASHRRRSRKKVALTAHDSMTGTSLQIYAAVPSFPHHRTIAEISRIARTSQVLSVTELLKMVHRGWITESPLGFQTNDDGHLVIDELRNKEFLKEWFLTEMKTASQLAEKDFNSHRYLFATSKFSISSSQVESLTHALRDTFSSWIEKHTVPDGDQVVTFTVAMN